MIGTPTDAATSRIGARLLLEAKSVLQDAIAIKGDAAKSQPCQLLSFTRERARMLFSGVIAREAASRARGAHDPVQAASWLANASRWFGFSSQYSASPQRAGASTASIAPLVREQAERAVAACASGGPRPASSLLHATAPQPAGGSWSDEEVGCVAARLHASVWLSEAVSLQLRCRAQAHIVQANRFSAISRDTDTLVAIAHRCSAVLLLQACLQIMQLDRHTLCLPPHLPEPALAVASRAVVSSGAACAGKAADGPAAAAARSLHAAAMDCGDAVLAALACASSPEAALPARPSHLRPPPLSSSTGADMVAPLTGVALGSASQELGGLQPEPTAAVAASMEPLSFSEDAFFSASVEATVALSEQVRLLVEQADMVVEVEHGGRARKAAELAAIAAVLTGKQPPTAPDDTTTTKPGFWSGWASRPQQSQAAGWAPAREHRCRPLIGISATSGTVTVEFSGTAASVAAVPRIQLALGPSLAEQLDAALLGTLAAPIPTLKIETPDLVASDEVMLAARQDLGRPVPASTPPASQVAGMATSPLRFENAGARTDAAAAATTVSAGPANPAPSAPPADEDDSSNDSEAGEGRDSPFGWKNLASTSTTGLATGSEHLPAESERNTGTAKPEESRQAPLAADPAPADPQPSAPPMSTRGDDLVDFFPQLTSRPASHSFSGIDTLLLPPRGTSLPPVQETSGAATGGTGTSVFVGTATACSPPRSGVLASPVGITAPAPQGNDVDDGGHPVATHSTGAHLLVPSEEAWCGVVEPPPLSSDSLRRLAPGSTGETAAGVVAMHESWKSGDVSSSTHPRGTPHRWAASSGDDDDDAAVVPETESAPSQCSAPRLPEGDDSALGSTFVSIVWDVHELDESVLFEVQWRRHGSPHWAFTGFPAAGTRATKDLLTPATTYEFRVREVSTANVAWSTVSAPITTKQAAPDVPIKLRVEVRAERPKHQQSIDGAQPSTSFIERELEASYAESRDPEGKGLPMTELRARWSLPFHDNGAPVTHFAVAARLGSHGDWFALDQHSRWHAVASAGLDMEAGRANKEWGLLIRRSSEHSFDCEDVPTIPMSSPLLQQRRISVARAAGEPSPRKRQPQACKLQVSLRALLDQASGTSRVDDAAHWTAVATKWGGQSSSGIPLVAAARRVRLVEELTLLVWLVSDLGYGRPASASWVPQAREGGLLLERIRRASGASAAAAAAAVAASGTPVSGAPGPGTSTPGDTAAAGGSPSSSTSSAARSAGYGARDVAMVMTAIHASSSAASVSRVRSAPAPGAPSPDGRSLPPSQGSGSVPVPSRDGPEGVPGRPLAAAHSGARDATRPISPATPFMDDDASGPTTSAAAAADIARDLEVSPDEIVWDDPRVFLGSGGFGDVFRTALNGFRGKTAAVKELRSTGSDGAMQEQADDLLLEIAMIAPLRHPALVGVIGYSLKLPRPYLMTEFAACGSLGDAIYRSGAAARWTLRAKLQVLLSIAEAVEFLHTTSPSIIHRDIKPANVLLFGDPRLVAEGPVGADASEQTLLELAEPSVHARVADFGLARVRKSSALRVRAAGTLDYCAPESFKQGRPVTDRVDVYSLAITMHELLSLSHAWGMDVNFETILFSVTFHGHRPDVGRILRSTRAKCIAGQYCAIAIRPDAGVIPAGAAAAATGGVGAGGGRFDSDEAALPELSKASRRLRSRIEMDLATLMSKMWRPVPEARPDMSDVCDALRDLLTQVDHWANTPLYE